MLLGSRMIWRLSLTMSAHTRLSDPNA